MTLPEMKLAIAKDLSWQSASQDDVAAFHGDVEVLCAIDKSWTWSELLEVCPEEWSSAVVNRCHRNEL
jgi:hypothetical protein